MSRLDFRLEATAPGSRARAARFRTAHNEVLTPTFMPVGTHASVRSQRNGLYLFGIVTLVAGLVVLRLLGAPAPILAMVASAALTSVLAWVINLFWKISVHASSMGSTATLASLYSEPLGLALWLCAQALGWARVRTRNHTPLQVAAGLALAAGSVVGTFMAFGLLS